MESTGDVCFGAVAARGSVTWPAEGEGSVGRRPLILLLFTVEIELDGVTRIDVYIVVKGQKEEGGDFWASSENWGL